MGTNSINIDTMKTVLALIILGVIVAATDNRNHMVVDVDVAALEPEHSSSLLNRDNFYICCSIGRTRCSEDCKTQKCSATCTARCGFFRVCPVLTCGDIAGSSCTQYAVNSSVTSVPAVS